MIFTFFRDFLVTSQRLFCSVHARREKKRKKRFRKSCSGWRKRRCQICLFWHRTRRQSEAMLKIARFTLIHFSVFASIVTSFSLLFSLRTDGLLSHTRDGHSGTPLPVCNALTLLEYRSHLLTCSCIDLRSHNVPHFSTTAIDYRNDSLHFLLFNRLLD